MDETQRRKLSAKEFIERNKGIGFIVITIFVSLFIIYFAAVFFYSRQVNEAQANVTATTTEEVGFLESLLPVFKVTENPDEVEDDGFLKNFSNLNPDDVSGENSSSNDNTKVIKIEDKPILGYTIFDKAISIKGYIRDVPKICTEKIEPVTTKEEKSTAVLNFQNTLKSISGFDATPITGILDTETRDKIYLFQNKYSSILYRNKEDKTPTRVIDKETAHFINLLCGIDKENKDDYVMVPTLRYVMKENRQIFDYNTESKQKIQIDAKEATGTEDMILSQDGNLAVFRRDINGIIDTIIYNIRNKSVTHLENNITTLDFNSKNILYYGTPGFNGIAVKKYDPLENRASLVMNVPLNEWTLSMIGDNQIGLVNKPTAFATGIFMILDTTTQKLRQVAGPLLGMAVQKTNNPEFAILSLGTQGTSKTLLLNNKTRNMGDFGIKTFAEKCSPTIFADGIFCAVPKNLYSNNIYPDDWYKGKVKSEDIIIFKTISGTTTRVVSFLENRPISVINLNVNTKGVFFMDENTYQLYSLEF